MTSIPAQALFPLLAIDSAGDELMMALSNSESQWLSTRRYSVSSQRSHSSLLVPEIKAMLSESGLTLPQIKSLALNRGPGSFTGLRASISLARSLGQFSPLKLYDFHHLELIAWQAFQQKSLWANQPEPKALSIALNARRGQAYYGCYEYRDNQFSELVSPQLLTLDKLSAIESSRRSTWLWDERLPRVETLESKSFSIKDLNYFAPTPMRELLLRAPKIEPTNWKELFPLYLQQPNISISKKPSILPNK